MSTITGTDTDLQRRVERELEWNPQVDSTGIAVKANRGMVTLAGHVASFAMKTAAGVAAHHVAGVLDVVDELEVRVGSPARTDQEIAQAVRDALVWDVFVPDQRIRSTVSHGLVTLEGEVELWKDREDAADCVGRLQGVRGVVNRIEVRPAPLDPAKIRGAIEDALVRRAHRGAKRLQISVADGVVTLRGQVDSWAEKQAIESLASHAPGVRRLVDELEIDPLV